MINLRIRTWWQPARKAGDPHDDRTVSFLELFYDLVYVVLVSEIAHVLAAHPDPKSIGNFVFLFSVVWWAWLNGTLYHDNHGNNDIRTRIFTFAQMFAVTGMAVFAHNALKDGSVGFAIFLGLFQSIMLFLFWRLRSHDPEHAEGNERFLISYTVVIAMIFLSVFVPIPYRFYIWGLAIIVNLLQPLLTFMRLSHRNDQERAIRIFSISPALIERFGLFNILVLAEIFVGVVQGLTSHHHLSSTAFVMGGLGMSVAFAMWWLYFDFISHRHPIAKSRPVATWIYMHLFVTMSIVATGAAILNVVEHAGEPLEPSIRWLLVGAVALFLLSLMPLMRVIEVMPELQNAYNIASWFLLFAAIVIAALGFTHLSALPLMVVIVVLLFLPVIYAWAFYVMVIEARRDKQVTAD